jgi:hypothetical protein
MSLDSIVSVSITANTANPTRAGFGTPGLVAYLPTSVFPERVREYTTLTGMVSDGFATSDPAYLMAVALKAQNPSVQNWKVCRRALPSQQSIRITPTITTEGEVLSITVNGTAVSYTILSGATVASICTALTALFAAIAGVTASDDTTHVTLTPKNVLSCTVTVDGVDNSQTYTVTIDETDYTYTSDASATDVEIRDGLEALIDAGESAKLTTTDNSTDATDIAFLSHVGGDVRVSVGGGSASLAISSEVSARRLLTIADASTGLTVKDLTADPGIATDWAAIIAEDPDFYGVAIDSQGEAEINALAALVETQRMLFVTGSIDTENTDSGTTTDVGSDLSAAAYDRTAVLQADSNSQYAGCRWLGRMLPKDPGSATWAFKTLAGLTVSSFTAAQQTALEGKNVNHYQTVGGLNKTRPGVAASGEFLDITRGIDWFQVRLQVRLFALIANLDKIPYSRAGRLIHAEIYAQMVEARDVNLLAPDTEDTPWVITIPDVGDISAANKALRTFPDVEFSAYLEGAVHKIEITGTLSV